MKALKDILLKASTDAEFRKALLDDPADALGAYDLTSEEIECLTEIQSEDQFATIAFEVDGENSVRASDIRI